MEVLEVSLAKMKRLVEEEIRQTFGGGVPPSLSPLETMYWYQMGFCTPEGKLVDFPRGKYMRPTLCLLMCSGLGGDPLKALPAAASLELIHRTSLIFDDIQDQGTERNNQPTVPFLWGDKQAINAGLALSAMARLALQRMFSSGPSSGLPVEDLEYLKGATPPVALQSSPVIPQCALGVWRAMEKAVLAICYGQYLDLSFQTSQKVSLKDYLTMIKGKTGALFGAACEVGAIVASADKELSPEVVPKARDFGRALGMAFQMHDDYLGIWGDEGEVGKTANDLMERKRSMPVVLAIEHFPDETISSMKTIVAWMNSPYVSRSDATKIRAWMEGHEIAKMVKGWEADTLRKAYRLLDELPLAGEYQVYMHNFLNSVTKRNK